MYMFIHNMYIYILHFTDCFAVQTRPFNLYIVAEDCAPPKDNEGIMYVHRGQIFDVLDSSSDWWLARLIRDVTSGSELIAEQGWVPGSFLDRFTGSLSSEEEKTVLTGTLNIHTHICMYA